MFVIEVYPKPPKRTMLLTNLIPITKMIPVVEIS